MTGATPNPTMPPDPTVFGRYWMQRDGTEDEDAWEVWNWHPECRCWFAYRASIEPSYAAERGWRCIAPAVPPSATESADA